MLTTQSNSAMPVGVPRRRRAIVADLAAIMDEAEPSGGKIAAGIIFTAPDGRVLLLKRSPDEKNYGGHWGLPGGKADGDETPEQCAKREAEEELGGMAPDGDLDHMHETMTPTGMVFHTYTQRVDKPFIPKLADGEHTDYKWSLPDKLPEPMHPRVTDSLKAMAADTASFDGLAALLGGDDFSESEHPRAPDGKFGSGGGSTSGGTEGGSPKTEAPAAKPTSRAKLQAKIKAHTDTIKKHGAETAEWLKGKSAGEVFKAIASDHRTQEGLSFALQSLLSHGTGFLSHATGGAIPNVQGLDPSTWHLNEVLFDHTVKHFGDIAKLTRVQAKDTMRKAVQGLISQRDAMRAGPKAHQGADAEPGEGETDGVTDALKALLDMLEEDDDDLENGSGNQEIKNQDSKLTATDSAMLLALDRDSVRDKDRDGRLRVGKTNLSKACVNPYKGSEIPDWEALGLDPDKVYRLLRDPEELGKAASTFNSVQLLRKHIPVSADDHQPWDTVGTTGSDAEFDGTYLKNSLSVWAQDAIDEIEGGTKKELSCGYHYKADMTPGSFNGDAYDGVMREIVGNHVALVADGRAGPDVVVGDSAEVMLWHVLERELAEWCAA